VVIIVEGANEVVTNVVPVIVVVGSVFVTVVEAEVVVEIVLIKIHGLRRLIKRIS
jgi:hypothetical protein